MRVFLCSFILRFSAALLLTLGGHAHALTVAEALVLATGDNDERIELMSQISASEDAQGQALARALGEGRVRIQAQRVLIINDDNAVDALSGESVVLTEMAEDALVNNRLRGAIEVALAGVDVLSGSPDQQLAAARILQRSAFDDPQLSQLRLLQKALALPKLAEETQQLLLLASAAVALQSEDVAVRLDAAQKLGEARRAVVRPLLLQAQTNEPDVSVQKALRASLAAVDRALLFSNILAQLFTGVSLGSILLLAALGLAITYGLMGVINMAHGELIMIGAYTTWLVHVAFRQWLPAFFDLYLWVAMPVAFFVSAAVGVLMERFVIRFLYGRPLETLLATWGISLVLMQTVRTLFGAQNVGVENPGWMSGSVLLMGNLSLPWNRVLIILFALTVLMGVALLISKTRLGLFVRGVTQNRPIASCMGVNTARVDTYAFALGSGVAGLAGCALSQIGNVGPDLGQNYIVDSFMVVVLGGVGQLAGTVYAALGLGLLNKFIEGWAGAVLAKITVLIFIIIFIQKRPQGIFAMKGRSAQS